MQAIHTNEKGFTLPEVLMATIIIAISVVAMIETMALVAITDADITRKMNANRIMHNHAHRYIRNQSVGFIYPGSGITAPIITSNTVNGVPTRRLLFRYTDAFGVNQEKAVTVFLPTP